MQVHNEKLEKQLRRYEEDASHSASQIAIEKSKLLNEKLKLEQQVRQLTGKMSALTHEKQQAESEHVLDNVKLEKTVSFYFIIHPSIHSLGDSTIHYSFHAKFYLFRNGKNYYLSFLKTICIFLSFFCVSGFRFTNRKKLVESFILVPKCLYIITSDKLDLLKSIILS